MSRLLFAAARGARFRYFNKHIGWCDMSIGHMVDAQRKAVIHPDDAHLQYGPISTALREAAVKSVPSTMVYDTVYGGTWGVAMPDWWKFRDCDDELHRSLFLLILAEALADEGL